MYPFIRPDLPDEGVGEKRAFVYTSLFPPSSPAKPRWETVDAFPLLRQGRPRQHQALPQRTKACVQGLARADMSCMFFRCSVCSIYMQSIL